ncbi:hypothetical protein [Shewanella frigidimarina]|uniref:hypothetical protein n=1 Tax=Shewanella frigidimarina TaxID=56812 RepID=UPI003D7B408E
MIKSQLQYSDSDTLMQHNLNIVFQDLYSYTKNMTFAYNRTRKDIVFDGFFPYYSNQKCKVLFIGRESLGLTGENYIDLMHHAYTQDKKIGNKTLNQHQFHALMMHISYGLNNDCCDWSSIPEATKIADSFATDNGISFAFMNLSKLSNESDDWKADWQLIDSFTDALNSSPENYFSKQIDAVNPDIILTMNLESRLKILGNFDVIEYGGNASYYYLQTKTKKYLVIDLFHFSAVKDSKSCFYEPVLNGIKKYSLTK